MNIPRPGGYDLFAVARLDGVGFDIAEASDTFSLGLSSMKERAVLVNGRLNIGSQPGKGTRLTLSVPRSRGET